MLSSLSPYLPKSLLVEALEAARAIKSDRYRAEALSSLVAHLTRGERERTMTEAFQAACDIGEERLPADALWSLLPYLPKVCIEEIFQKALGVRDAYSREGLFKALAPHLADRDRQPHTRFPEAVTSFLHAVRIMEAYGRRELLDGMTALQPWLVILAPPAALSALAQSIVDVGRWRP